MQVYETDYKVKSYDVDLHKKMKLSRLFHLFQEAAYQHASILNFGYQDLIKENMFWVLARVKVNFERLPEWNENIKMKTWPKPARRLFAYRDFQIFDEKQNNIIQATSAWLVVNIDTKRPVRINRNLDYFKPKVKKNALDAELKKIQIPDNIARVEQRKVKYSDLDLNNHVNNATYLDWLSDSLDIAYLREHSIKNIAVNFQKETGLDDEIDIFTTSSKNRIYSLYQKDDQDIFRARLELN
ncbi:MAG TPA: acyl-ACP thioesterase domain-containing protein [bacterium]|nr:acyl-ACP thioesterase domain-containing protein [bacterium]